MLQIYKSLESGPLQELTLKTLEKGAWINIVDPTPYELKVVSNLTEVDPDFLRSALDDEERSHTDVEENSVMVLTNVPVFRGEDSYDALPLAIIVTDEFIITVCLEETPVITEFNERTSRLFRTYKKTRFLFQILYKSATYFLRYLRQISKLSEEIEDQLRHDMKNSEILRLLELQKGLTYFNAALRSNGAFLDKLLRLRTNPALQPILKMYEEDEDLLQTRAHAGSVPSARRRATATSAEQTSANDESDASMLWGSSDVSVMPGATFTSMNTGSPSQTMMSVRERSRRPRAWWAASASSAQRAASASEMSAGVTNRVSPAV